MKAFSREINYVERFISRQCTNVLVVEIVVVVVVAVVIVVLSYSTLITLTNITIT